MMVRGGIGEGGDGPLFVGADRSYKEIRRVLSRCLYFHRVGFTLVLLQEQDGRSIWQFYRRRNLKI
jgi:hypothetical protein